VRGRLFCRRRRIDDFFSFSRRQSPQIFSEMLATATATAAATARIIEETNARYHYSL